MTPEQALGNFAALINLGIQRGLFQGADEVHAMTEAHNVLSKIANPIHSIVDGGIIEGNAKTVVTTVNGGIYDGKSTTSTATRFNDPIVKDLCEKLESEQNVKS